MTRDEIFAKKENRLVLLEGQSTRTSVTNLMRNIAILTPIQVPLADLQKAVPEYEQNFDNLLHALNENKSEHLFDSSIFAYLPEMDTNLGDYLMTVSNLIEQYQPFNALGVKLVATPMYSDVICYKLTNVLATKLIEKFDLDIQTNNLDALDALQETLHKLCEARYYTLARYKKQFNLDLPDTDPDLVDNYREYLDQIVENSLPRLIVQNKVIIEPIGLEEVVSNLKTKLPEIANMLEIPDLTAEVFIDLVKRIEAQVKVVYGSLSDNPQAQEDLRLRAVDAFSNDVNEFIRKNSLMLQTENQVGNGKELFNAVQYNEVLMHALLYASQELQADELDYESTSEIFKYIITILEETVADIAAENIDLFELDDTFAYKYLSCFHIVFNADFSVVSSMFNQQLMMAYQNLANILSGVTPEQARAEMNARMAAMQEQGGMN